MPFQLYEGDTMQPTRPDFGIDESEAIGILVRSALLSVIKLMTDTQGLLKDFDTHHPTAPELKLICERFVWTATECDKQVSLIKGVLAFVLPWAKHQERFSPSTKTTPN
jgi:hypothetical protein